MPNKYAWQRLVEGGQIVSIEDEPIEGSDVTAPVLVNEEGDRYPFTPQLFNYLREKEIENPVGLYLVVHEDGTMLVLDEDEFNLRCKPL